MSPATGWVEPATKAHVLRVRLRDNEPRLRSYINPWQTSSGRPRGMTIPMSFSFEEALRLAEQAEARPHVLLGNGFSIAYDHTAFSYGRLLDEADFSQLSVDARAIFEQFGTADFEQVIEILRTAAELLRIYAPTNTALAGQIAADAERLKDALAEVLARKHPDNVGTVTPEEYASARPVPGALRTHLHRQLTTFCCTGPRSRTDRSASSPTTGFSESEEEPAQSGWPGNRWTPSPPSGSSTSTGRCTYSTPAPSSAS